MKQGTLQTVVTAGAAGAAIWYSWKSSKGLPVGSLIVVLAATAGWIVGGYAETVLIK